MSFGGRALVAVAVACACTWAGAMQLSRAAASPDARYVAQWVLDSRDNGGLPFAIVDKKDARLYVFDAAGRLAGATPALLGSAHGDDSAPGIGEREPKDILPHERTTPAGRFVSEPGRNLGGEHVVWVDYDAAVAIHRLRPDAAQHGRQQRLASAGVDDNRTSLGCVVVPVAFYESVVQKFLGRHPAVVYVLPETRPVREMFGTAAALASR